MKSVKVQYAKTHLSALLAAVEQGEEIILARGDRPVARLSPLLDQHDRELGFVTYAIPEQFFEPLPEEELADWEVGVSTLAHGPASTLPT